MTLFSGANDMISHQVRIVLAEKGVSVDICQVDPANLPDRAGRSWNPYNTVPTLVDRELALYTLRIIAEHLTSCFPHPPPDAGLSGRARGNSRLMMHRIELDWYSGRQDHERAPMPGRPQSRAAQQPAGHRPHLRRMPIS